MEEIKTERIKFVEVAKDIYAAITPRLWVGHHRCRHDG